MDFSFCFSQLVENLFGLVDDVRLKTALIKDRKDIGEMAVVVMVVIMSFLIKIAFFNYCVSSGDAVFGYFFEINSKFVKV